MERLVWHIPYPGYPLPRYYINRDSKPIALRVYTENAPNGGDLLVDVLDDDVSIMNSNNYSKVEIKNEQAYIEYGTPVGTFTAGETITGGTSSATAKVAENKLGRLTLAWDTPSGVFTVGETITGSSSAATGVVNSYVRQTKSGVRTAVSGQSHAGLAKGKNSNDHAEDFIDSVQVDEGSWLSLSVLDYAGASNITVQIDMEILGDNSETKPARAGAR